MISLSAIQGIPSPQHIVGTLYAVLSPALSLSPWLHSTQMAPSLSQHHSFSLP